MATDLVSLRAWAHGVCAPYAAGTNFSESLAVPAPWFGAAFDDFAGLNPISEQVDDRHDMILDIIRGLLSGRFSINDVLPYVVAITTNYGSGVIFAAIVVVALWLSLFLWIGFRSRIYCCHAQDGPHSPRQRQVASCCFSTWWVVVLVLVVVSIGLGAAASTGVNAALCGAAHLIDAVLEAVERVAVLLKAFHGAVHEGAHSMSSLVFSLRMVGDGVKPLVGEVAQVCTLVDEVMAALQSINSAIVDAGGAPVTNPEFDAVTTSVQSVTNVVCDALPKVGPGLDKMLEGTLGDLNRVSLQ